MQEKRQMLITENIWLLMLKLCLPAIFGMLVIGLYNFVDAIFVGKYVGEMALGAISISYPFTLINNGIAVLVGIGSASVLSRAIGREDQATMDKIMGNLLALTFLLSLAVMAVGLMFTPQIISLAGGEGQMLSFGVRYLRIIYIGSFFVNFAQSANMVMRGEGKMGMAMGIMAMGAVLNIILDAIFVIGLRMGIEGAATATVIAQVTQAIFTFFYFLWGSKSVRFHKIKIETDILPEILSVGVSAMLMQVMSLFQQTVMYATLKNTGGDAQVILMGATMRFMMLSFIPIWGVSQGFQPMAGTNYGAKAYERVKKSTWIFGFGATLLAVAFWIPFMLNPKGILGLFINDPAIISAGYQNAMLAYSIFPISGFLIIAITLFQSLGKAKKAGLLVLLRQAALFIPLVLILAQIFGAKGVWMALPLTDLAVFLIGFIAMKKVFRHLEEEPIATPA